MGDFDSTYDDGVSAGDHMLALIRTIDPRLSDECGVFLGQPELEPVLTWITRQTRYNRPVPYVNGFLSRVLKPQGLRSSIVDLWGARDLIADQGNVAPICNVPAGSGLVQIGSWTGDRSDGDAWCLDLHHDCIRCIPVGSGDDDLDLVRLASYGVLPTFLYWVAYLRCSAYQRGWLKEF